MHVYRWVTTHRIIDRAHQQSVDMFTFTCKRILIFFLMMDNPNVNYIYIPMHGFPIAGKCKTSLA